MLKKWYELYLIKQITVFSLLIYLKQFKINNMYHIH